MSIVERALEKVRAEKKSSEPTKPVMSAESANQSADISLTQPGVASQVVKIDLTRLRNIGRLPLEAAAHHAKEEMRRIKWPLLGAIRGDKASAPVRNNIIQVSSSLPNEGKTYTALMLALSLVQDRELRVVLVDGDVARPGLTPALELNDKRGLLDVLAERDLDIGMATYQTDIEGLFVIPSGTWHEQASELLSSSRMPVIFDDIIRRLGNGVIILDSPPLLATNEAQVLSRYVGQVLFVVRADETEQHAIRDAIALIDRGAKTSAILNSVRPSRFARYYGQYGYGYGYGYGNRDRDKSSEKSESKASTAT